MALFRAIALAAVATAVLFAPASADEKPWTKGVSEADKQNAETLLEQGNALFLEARYLAALEVYRRAIASWDHPAIRFNIVRVLINLDKQAEAFANLEKALAYGADPLEPSVFREAQAYRKLLLNQIAELEVRCAQRGVTITVDGEQFLECPGVRSTRLSPGSHAVAGTKPDHLTTTHDLVLLGGKTEKLEVTVLSIEDATVSERRWARWKPWAVVGGGVVLAGGSYLLQRKAASDFDAYGDDLVDLCSQTGCTPEDLPSSTANLESRARLENRVAVSGLITAGAVVVSGLAMVILNRPRPVLQERPLVAPSVTTTSAGLVFTARF